MRQLDLGLKEPRVAPFAIPSTLAPEALPLLSLMAGTKTPSLSDWLASRLGRRAQVVFTRNRTTMLSFSERNGVLRVRLHEIFNCADLTVWSALADYIVGRDRGATKIIDQFVAAHPRSFSHKANKSSGAPGRFHDLRVIFDELNDTYFHGAVRAAITWGTVSPRRYRRTIQLGLYLRNEALIRIHPSLDQAFVPHHYVAWVVFHEMLHDVFGIDVTRRRGVHPPEFNVIEQSYPHYALCKKWEQQNLYRLLRFRPKRKDR